MKHKPILNRSGKRIWKAVLCYFCLSVNAVAESSDQIPSSSTGAEVYARRCSVCHGDDGAGARWAGASLKPAPRNFTDPVLRDSLTRSHMISSVINGRPGTAMPAFGSRFDHELLADVVDYIRTEFMQISLEANMHNHVDTQATKQDLAYADAEAGGIFYNNNCATCHGVEGDGAGPRAYFIFPRPANFREHAKLGNLTRDSLFGAIKHGIRGKEMPAWGTVLSDQQISNVTEYVYLRFIESEHAAKTE